MVGSRVTNDRLLQRLEAIRAAYYNRADKYEFEKLISDLMNDINDEREC